VGVGRWGIICGFCTNTFLFVLFWKNGREFQEIGEDGWKWLNLPLFCWINEIPFLRKKKEKKIQCPMLRKWINDSFHSFYLKEHSSVCHAKWLKLWHRTHRLYLEEPRTELLDTREARREMLYLNSYWILGWPLKYTCMEQIPCTLCNNKRI
jgi:hypothetical protein